MIFSTIEYKVEKHIASIILSRPEVNNALNKEMIQEIIDAVKLINDQPGIRFLVLEGYGKIFSSGADLNWMKDSFDLSFEENRKDAQLLALCLYRLYSTPKTTIAKVHGGAYGGAVGLMTACDFIFSEKLADFSFSEVKLGLVPAVIAPYIINRIGIAQTKDLMITGKTIKGNYAQNIGLVNRCYDGIDELKNYTNSFLEELSEAAPIAQSQIKQMINNFSPAKITEDLIKQTSELLAEIRVGDEAKSGIISFFQRKYRAGN